MKLTNSLCLVLLMSSVPVHATLAADEVVNDEAQVTTAVDADQSPASEANLNNDNADFNGPGRPGGGGPRPGPGQQGPRPGNPGGGGFHPGPQQPVGPRPPVVVGPRPIEPIGPRPPVIGPRPPVIGPRPPVIGPRPPVVVGPRPPFGGPGRVFAPYPIRQGQYPGPAWNHPFFPRPVYGWNWNQVETVTCTAADSYGNQYPVTESDYVGPAYQAQINNIEDAALDMCFNESGDQGCHFEGCNPGY
jgi:hypothetical protein